MTHQYDDPQIRVIPPDDKNIYFTVLSTAYGQFEGSLHPFIGFHTYWHRKQIPHAISCASFFAHAFLSPHMEHVAYCQSHAMSCMNMTLKGQLKKTKTKNEENVFC